MSGFKSISIMPLRSKYGLDESTSIPMENAHPTATKSTKKFVRSFSARSANDMSQLIGNDSLTPSSETLPQPTYEIPSFHALIDNSKRIYTPYKLKCGVSIQIGERVLKDCPKILEYLNHDLLLCLSVLPSSVRSLVRRTKIWLNRTYSYGPKDNPRTVNHSTAHHYAAWLLCVRDSPEKEESIEIYDAAEYQKTRAHYNGGGLMLHELCHLIHQKALPGGLDNSMVIEMHKVAKESDKYNTVLRRDWALKDRETDMAYCIVNHKEFFAEISTTFLANFYHEFDGAGNQDMEKCSPPFVSAAVIERIIDRCGDGSFGKYQVMQDTNRILPHCNKFFPFTKGQLRLYDPRVYKCFEKLWQHIETWEDKDKKRCESCVWF